MGSMTQYHAALAKIPPPGKGLGCHTSLLSVANYGAIAGVAPTRMYDDIRAAIPRGNRKIRSREIQDAIDRACTDHTAGPFTLHAKPKPVVRNGKDALKQLLAQGKYSDEADLWEASPIRLLVEPAQDAPLFLSILYEPEELIWIGDRHQAGIRGMTIRTRDDWIRYYKNGGTLRPHIILNPVNGLPAPVKSGGRTTLRGDANILSYRFCLAEFDSLSRSDQIRFWSAVKLPIVALIDSGGKSIHAWIDVQELAMIETPDHWETSIKCRLYDRQLVPLGVDCACSNPARLSRLPGHFREEKGRYQRLMWLSPEGRSIACQP